MNRIYSCIAAFTFVATSISFAQDRYSNVPLTYVSVSTFTSGTGDLTLTDPFTYNPQDPTATTPQLSYSFGGANHGWHSSDNATDSIVFDLTTPTAIVSGDTIFVDLWGRGDCCADRSDNLTLMVYDGSDNLMYTSPTFATVETVDNNFIRVAVISTDVNADVASFVVKDNVSGFTHLLEVRMTYVDNTITSASGISAIENSVSVAPNPVQDILNISMESNLSTQLNSYTVSNLRGEILRTSGVDSDNFSIDLTGVQSGMYLLSFNTSEGNFVKKVIVE